MVLSAHGELRLWDGIPGDASTASLTVRAEGGGDHRASSQLAWEAATCFAEQKHAMRLTSRLPTPPALWSALGSASRRRLLRVHGTSAPIRLVGLTWTEP
jgi:hypothetical protein